jgi:ribulose kinase
MTCDYCAAALFGRSDRRFCDATCRARWHARERRRVEAAVWLDELVDVMMRPGARSFAELVRSSREVART